MDKLTQKMAEFLMARPRLKSICGSIGSTILLISKIVLPVFFVFIILDVFGVLNLNEYMTMFMTIAYSAFLILVAYKSGRLLAGVKSR